MSSPFVAEIRMFGFNFAPVGWALCNGQLMPISQNTALFSLLGTQYGGDGKSTSTTTASGNVYKSGQIPGSPPKVVASYTTATPNTILDPRTVNVSGSSLPHNNLMPYLAVNFCIALQGIFPARP
jgi:microcystin-dependent protein